MKISKCRCNISEAALLIAVSAWGIAVVAATFCILFGGK
jgi:hypothetical protein